MHNVVITSIQMSGSGGSSDPMLESLTLNYAGIEHDYTQQSNTGDPMGTVHFGRDIQKNQNL
jgi:type VI protein secretion system component Hcp